MKISTLRRWWRPLTILGVIALLAATLLVTTVAASPGASYSLDWFTVDGGGGTSTGGSYSLSGTIGQPDAGARTGGIYALAGGFWVGVESLIRVYIPLVMRNFH